VEIQLLVRLSLVLWMLLKKIKIQKLLF